MSEVKTPEQIAAEAAQATELKAKAKAEADAKKAEAKAQADAAKAAAKAEKEKKATEAKAAKDAQIAEAKALKEVKAKEAAEAKAAVAAKKEKVVMPSKNGITRPKPEGACGQVWALADAMSMKLGQPVPIAQLTKETQAAGLNDATTRTQYARWKTFNGVFGAVPKIAEPVAEVPVVQTTEPVAA